jgi:hypothetical protein
MMQYVGQQGGLKVVMSPECQHCEIAGECVEILWGIGKVGLRREPMSERDTADTLRALVRRTWARENIGRKELCGAYRTHRSYILVYRDIHKKQAAEEFGLEVNDQSIDASLVLKSCSSVDFKTIQKKMQDDRL